MNKSTLRRQLRSQRARIPEDDARRAARQAANRLWRLPCMAGAGRIALYFPVGSELDAAPAILGAWRRGRRAFLPVVRGSQLCFARFHAGSIVTPNRYGIPEPQVAAHDLVSADKFDVIIVPLLGFDARGYRLGMGGGYYDRALGFRLRRTKRQRPHLIGLAYEMQRVRSLEVEPHDVQLDAVVTEERVHRFPSPTPLAGNLPSVVYTRPRLPRHGDVTMATKRKAAKKKAKKKAAKKKR
jgi:5-formyltetrahydrofolate cyclo-ligase